jgi:signal transduction histidine kinase/CheY-like chemotaxis protein
VNAPAGWSAPDRAGAALGGAVRVLIVEDNPEDAETFCRYLEATPGRTCRHAPLGEEALDLLISDPPDCVLLDYGLPDMTGLEWLREARAAGSDCAVVVLTGLGDESVAVAVMKAGAQDYLVKGRITAHELGRAVDGAAERWRLQRELAVANERTRTILASVTDAFVALDAGFRFRYVNAAAEALSHRPPGQLLGQLVWEAFPWLNDHDAGTQLRAAQSGRLVLRFETRYARLGAWYEVRAYPESGGGLTVYVSDVSERRRLETERHRASERLEQLYRTGLALNRARSRPEVILTLAEQATKVLGAVAGTFALMSDDDSDLLLTGHCDAARSGEPVLLRGLEEATLWYPRLFDGGAALGHAAWAAVPFLLADRVLGSMGLIYAAPQAFSPDDQTLLRAFAELGAQALGRAQLHETELDLRLSLERRVEERTAELRQSNSELEQFAAVASHDLREPLRTVSSYSQLLAGRYGPLLDERGLRYVEFILDGTTRMHHMVEDLLDLSRIGTHASAQAVTDTGALVDAAAGLLEAMISESGAQVTRGPLPRLTADASQLTQLFQNLIANAVKFRREAVTPQVHVSAELSGAEWRFSVSDNGIGVAPEHRERVFTLFQRLHSRQAYPGNGIGLSVCQKIVLRHGGRLWLESVPGQGSTFSFTLPAGGPP